MVQMQPTPARSATLYSEPMHGRLIVSVSVLSGRSSARKSRLGAFLVFRAHLHLHTTEAVHSPHSETAVLLMLYLA